MKLSNLLDTPCCCSKTDGGCKGDEAPAEECNGDEAPVEECKGDEAPSATEVLDKPAC